MNEQTKTDKATVQIGTDPVAGYAIRTVEFAMRNGWDFCAGAAFEYLVRWCAKGEVEDLNHAKHFVQLRHELIHKADANVTLYNFQQVIPVAKFVVENNLGERARSLALYCLESWIFTGDDHEYKVLIALIDNLVRKAPNTSAAPNETDGASGLPTDTEMLDFMIRTVIDGSDRDAAAKAFAIGLFSAMGMPGREAIAATMRGRVIGGKV